MCRHHMIYLVQFARIGNTLWGKAGAEIVDSGKFSPYRGISLCICSDSGFCSMAVAVKSRGSQNVVPDPQHQRLPGDF